MFHTTNKIENEEIETDGNNIDYGYYIEFHASDINLMNDKSENRLLKAITDRIPNELESILGLAQWITGQVYCASFCTLSDYIPMWKIYAANNNPICLKFKVEGLSDEVVELVPVKEGGRLSEDELIFVHM